MPVRGHCVSAPSELICRFRAGLSAVSGTGNSDSACPQSENAGMWYSQPRLPWLLPHLCLRSGLPSVRQLRSDSPRALGTPVWLPLCLRAENPNLCDADLIVFQAIDSGYRVPTVRWGRCLEKKAGRGGSHIPLLLPTALTPPLVRFCRN